MTNTDPYDDDFFAWTQEQAAALRQLPTDIVGNRLDIAHVAEEIEDLGKRDLREVCSFLRLHLQHLLKVHADPASPAVPHWRDEILEFRRSAVEAFTPGMRQLIDLDLIWQKAKDAAVEDLQARGLAFSAAYDCPFAFDEVMTDAFDLDAALAQLATAASSAA